MQKDFPKGTLFKDNAKPQEWLTKIEIPELLYSVISLKMGIFGSICLRNFSSILDVEDSFPAYE